MYFTVSFYSYEFENPKTCMPSSATAFICTPDLSRRLEIRPPNKISTSCLPQMLSKRFKAQK